MATVDLRSSGYFDTPRGRCYAVDNPRCWSSVEELRGLAVRVDGVPGVVVDVAVCDGGADHTVRDHDTLNVIVVPTAPG